MTTHKAKLKPVHNTLLEVGDHTKPAHYAVIGHKTDFYLWMRNGAFPRGASRNVRGRLAFKMFSGLCEAMLVSDASFIETFKAYYEELK